MVATYKLRYAIITQPAMLSANCRTREANRSEIEFLFCECFSANMGRGLQSAIIVALIAALITYSQLDDGRPATIEVVKVDATLDRFISLYRDKLGVDVTGYRGHCLRVFSFTLHLLGGNVTATEREAIATALAFHDIALWSDNALSYLEPSVAQAFKHVNGNLALIRDCIEQHHKITPFSSNNPRHDQIVNAFRKADWIDASLGLVHFGIGKANIRRVLSTIPNDGFHNALLKFSLQPTGYKVLSILKW
jgi:hypothetical protein